MEASIALASGYTESKWVGETLLKGISEELTKAGTPLRTVVVRLGQITGSSGNGAWNTSEQIPTLVKSSAYLGCLPDFNAVRAAPFSLVIPFRPLAQEASWIPVDAAARAAIDMLRSSGPAFSTYHLTHPRPVHWRTLFTPIAQALGLQSVAYDVWLRQLRNSSERSEHMLPEQEVAELQRNPALKILEHFEQIYAGGAKEDVNSEHHAGGLIRKDGNGALQVHGGDEASELKREALGLPTLSVSQAVQIAPSLGEKNLPQLTAKVAMQWLQYWRSIGYLQ